MGHCWVSSEDSKKGRASTRTIARLIIPLIKIESQKIKSVRKKHKLSFKRVELEVYGGASG